MGGQLRLMGGYAEERGRERERREYEDEKRATDRVHVEVFVVGETSDKVDTLLLLSENLNVEL
eukprot:608476-Amorphochlora_amoeboformis.AAC.1